MNALRMAERNALERRVQAVLRPDSKRNGAALWPAVALSMVAAALAAPVALTGFETKTAKPPALMATNRSSAVGEADTSKPNLGLEMAQKELDLDSMTLVVEGQDSKPPTKKVDQERRVVIRVGANRESLKRARAKVREELKSLDKRIEELKKSDKAEAEAALKAHQSAKAALESALKSLNQDTASSGTLVVPDFETFGNLPKIEIEKLRKLDGEIAKEFGPEFQKRMQEFGKEFGKQFEMDSQKFKLDAKKFEELQRSAEKKGSIYRFDAGFGLAEESLKGALKSLERANQQKKLSDREFRDAKREIEQAIEVMRKHSKELGSVRMWSTAPKVVIPKFEGMPKVEIRTIPMVPNTPVPPAEPKKSRSSDGQKSVTIYAQVGTMIAQALVDESAGTVRSGRHLHLRVDPVDEAKIEEMIQRSVERQARLRDGATYTN